MVQILVAVASILSGGSCRLSLAEACCWPEWLRTGVEQASIPTAVEYGSVDCKPDGNAHGYGKGCKVRGLWPRVARPAAGAALVPHWVPWGARRCALRVKLGARALPCRSGEQADESNIPTRWYQGLG